MYYGEHHILIDGKGRVQLPAVIGEEVEQKGHFTWWITQGFDRQLFLFHEVDWQKLLETVIPPAGMNPRTMDFRRRFVGGAQKVAADRQMRLLIPAPLRVYADISRETVLLGIEDRMELWGYHRWKEYRDGRVSEYRDMAMDYFGQRRLDAAQTQEEADHVGM